MSRLIIAFIGFFGLGFYANAQISIQTTIPTVGLIQKNQLWNLLLMNGTGTSVNGKFELVLLDRQSGMELMTATTANFTLGKGSLQTNVTLLSPIQYTLSGMEPHATINDLLPVGSYSACFTFVGFAGQKQSILAEECVSFDIEPLSPPMLMFPSDSSILSVQPSQFTWMPPTPSSIIRHLNYELLITEIKLGQKPNEALQQNMPFYSSMYITTNFLSYPATFPSFDKDKWYAWQVIARDGSTYAAKTDAWVFNTAANKRPQPDSATVQYVQLAGNNILSGVNHLADHNLSVKYYSFDKNRRGTIRLLTTDGNVVETVKQSILYGDNFLVLNLNSKFRQGQVYVIELVDEQKNVHKSLFSIR